MKKIFLSIAVSAVLVSCSSVATSKPGTVQPNLTGSSWVVSDNVKGTAPTLVIEEGKVSGNGGCNNYFSDLTLNSASGSFKTGSIGATKKACDNMSSEQNFLQMLETANKYVVKDNVLELYKDSLLLLKLNKKL